MLACRAGEAARKKEGRFVTSSSVWRAQQGAYAAGEPEGTAFEREGPTEAERQQDSGDGRRLPRAAV